MKYQLEITPKQLEIVKNSLDVYGRLQQGSIDLALDVAIGRRVGDAIVNDRLIHPLQPHSEVDVLKMALFPELARNEHYGVGNKQVPEFGLSYTVYNALRYRQFLDSQNKESLKDTVDSYPPMKYGSEPIPKITKVED
ncbi:hypothetical protein FEZ51_02005 [Pediococcus stilesii]|uniref:Uncharacterized protein n=1 Tax=Pediococcus stilesii TaxID=331679 RepID=A0A5R9BXT7_9LACO|nr:hypothetical protein [Pediococcus stilesii]TLQ05457.1 hypothetical protein FEZ51_02005 [Pediococcus stilesii]